MGRNSVLCLGGTRGQITTRGNTDVVRLFGLLDLGDDAAQDAWYDAGAAHRTGPQHAPLRPCTQAVPEGAQVHPSVRYRRGFGTRSEARIPAGAAWEEDPWPTPQG